MYSIDSSLIPVMFCAFIILFLCRFSAGSDLQWADPEVQTQILLCKECILLLHDVTCTLTIMSLYLDVWVFGGYVEK